MARIKGKSIVFEVNGTEYAGGVSNVVFSSAVNTLGFGNYEDSLDFTCAVTGFQDTACKIKRIFVISKAKGINSR